MEIDLENLYVDVRAKKIEDHCHLATHSKLAFLWKKSLFGWQKYSWQGHPTTIFGKVSVRKTI